MSATPARVPKDAATGMFVSIGPSAPLVRAFAPNAALRSGLEQIGARLACIVSFAGDLREMLQGDLLEDAALVVVEAGGLPDELVRIVARRAGRVLLIDKPRRLRAWLDLDVERVEFLAPPVSSVVLQRHLQAALAAREARDQLNQYQRSLGHMRRLTRISRVGYWGWNLGTRQWHWSAGVGEALGLGDVGLGRTFEEFLDAVHGEDRARVKSAFGVAAGEAGAASVECRLREASQETYLLLTMEATRDEQGRTVHLYGTVQNVTDYRNAQALIHHHQNHDDLTGLPNKALFTDRLEQAMRRADEREELLAILLIDLDRFKVVNKHLSHAAGDLLLTMIGARLQRWVRECDTVARLLGDEFAVLLEGIKDVAAITSAVARLEQEMSQPFELEGQEFFMSMSIGIAVYPLDETSTKDLLRGAEHAVAKAKRRGGRRAEYFTADFGDVGRERIGLEAGLHKAVENGELVLHYQPQARADDLRIVGLEALVRWQHPELGLLGPDRFIAIAEETGLIIEIGAWVLRSAVEQLLAWEQEGFGGLRMGINLSVRQFLDERFVEQVAHVLEQSALDARRLDLEVTESIAMQGARHNVEVLNQLKSVGVGLSMDDFGTGYSSLSYLQSLPFDTIKIDRTFVGDIAPEADGAIARTVIAMGHSLGKRVIAEGVESDYQLEFMRAHGCDEFQGFLLSKPLAAEHCTRFLREHFAGR